MNYIDLAIKSILAATIGWFILSFLRRSSASTRHFALLVTLIGVSLLPAASMLMPSWQVPFLHVNADVAQVTKQVGSGATSGIAANAQLVNAIDHSTTLNPNLLLFIWAAVAGLLSLRLVTRLVRLKMAERRMPMSTDSALHTLVAALCRRSSRHVVLLEGEEGRPPMTWGFSRPVLVFPTDAQTWPSDRIESVVLHELAHIERGDWLASIVAQFACAVNWFNPFVWVIRKQMEQESETAADDRVLSSGVSATQYASHLVSVTRELCTRRSSTDVALAMARPGTLDRRIRAILEARRCRRNVRGVVSLGLAAVITGIVVVLGAAVPSIRQQLPHQGPSVSVDVTPTPSIARDLENLDSPRPGFDVKDLSDQKLAAKSAETREGLAETGSGTLRAREPKPSKSAQGATSTSHSVTGTKAGSSSLTVGGVPDPADMKIDFKEMEAEMKRAGVEVDAETQKAFKEVSNISIDTKGLIDAVTKVTSASTKAAIASAQKLAKSEIKSALEELKRHQHEKSSTHVKPAP